MSSDENSFGAIAAANSLFGVINFIVLSLPNGWKLVADRIPPEVDKIFRRGDVKWALEGQARSIAVYPEGVVEVNITIIEGNKIKSSGMETIINGHRGYYGTRRIRRGLFKKREYEVVDISFYCEETNRTIRLSLVSNELEKYVDAILEAVSQSICH